MKRMPAGRNPGYITHAQNDARYIEQGMLLFLAPDPDSAKDLAKMNKKKNGVPF